MAGTAGLAALSGNELKYVTECITTGWVSSRGRYVADFETAVGDFVGSRFALSTSSGTLALQLALQALDIGPGDEVIVPNFTFGASANAVVQRGATPVFADIDPATWTLEPARIEPLITPRTRAIMPVHVYGHPCDMDAIIAIARRHGLRVIEDCAEALGAAYRDKSVGTIGDVGCFSFFANKVVTTGEGGMVTTNDPEAYERLKLLRDHGMRSEEPYWHVEPGTNARMTNLQAAVGLAQMERVREFLRVRDDLAERYTAELAGIPGVTPHTAAPWARKICWLYSVRIDPPTCGMNRDTLMARLKQLGIETRPVFKPLYGQPAYAGSRAGPVPECIRLGAEGLSLPTRTDMPIIELLRVATEIRQLSRAAA